MPTMIEQRMTSAFTVRSLRPEALPMGHVLNVDHFHMSQPTFPPHPHAGFSAVTWMLPWSQGGFVNRDSRGDRSRIGPGALHWTLAGSGMLHEEIPEHPGQDCEGLQIFVKLPEELETMPPETHHLDAHEVPVLRAPGGTVRVLVGEHAGVASPMPSHARATLLHIEVTGELELELPRGVEAFAAVLRGGGRVSGVERVAGEAATLLPPRVVLAGEDLRALVAWSDPMPGRPVFQGPFCMFRRERLAQARSDYTAGALGRLEPSEVRWVH